MKKIISLSILGISLTALIGNLSASDGNGSVGAPFLNIPVGARAISMGQSAVAVSEDPTAMFWNPAALSLVGQPAVSIEHSLYPESSFHDFAAFVLPINERHALGASVNYFNYGSIMQADEFDTSSTEITPHDLAATGGYALKGSFGSLGISGRYIETTISRSAKGYDFDAGILSRPLLSDRLVLGAAYSNFGGKLKKDGESLTLPGAFRAGVGVKILRNWLVSADYVLPRWKDNEVAVGTEFTLNAGQSFAIKPRMGFNSGVQKNVEDSAGLSYGLGLAWSNIVVDYAFTPFGELGSTQQIDLLLKFGKSKSSEPQQRSTAVLTEAVSSKIKSVAVLAFESRAISQVDADVLGDYVRAEFVQSKKFKVVDRNNTEKIVSEQKFQNNGITSPEKAAEIGRLLNVDFIIMGSVSMIDRTYHVNVNCVDVQSAQIVTSQVGKATSSGQMPVVGQQLTKRAIADLSIR